MEAKEQWEISQRAGMHVCIEKTHPAPSKTNQKGRSLEPIIFSKLSGKENSLHPKDHNLHWLFQQQLWKIEVSRAIPPNLKGNDFHLGILYSAKILIKHESRILVKHTDSSKFNLLCALSQETREDLLYQNEDVNEGVSNNGTSAGQKMGNLRVVTE